MTRLFIDNQEIELTDSISFAITKQFEDITNPTVIINDWTKTVEIPATATNNNIFNHIYNPDRITGDGEGMFVHFDPYKKIDFRLEWNNSVLMIGYMKLNSATKKSYNITLNGTLGKIFQEMKKITFDPTVVDEDGKSGTDSKYYLDGSVFVDSTINRNIIRNSWMADVQSTPTLQPIKIKQLQPDGSVKYEDNIKYKQTDIIGFAPNNAKNESFDYESFERYGESKKFEDTLSEHVIDGKTFLQETGLEASVAIPNGLNPREIGEYRSYLQLPFVFWNKLFQMFQQKAEELTGYTFDLDTEWFSTDNPYWYNLVMMLEQINPKQSSTLENSYSNQLFFSNGSSDVMNSWQSNESDYRTKAAAKPIEIGSIVEERFPGCYTEGYHADSHFTIQQSGDTYIAKLNLPMFIELLQRGTTQNLATDNALVVEINMRKNGTVVKTTKSVIYKEGFDVPDTLQYYNRIKVDGTFQSPSSAETAYMYYNLTTAFDIIEEGDYSFTAVSYWCTNNNPIDGSNQYALYNRVTSEASRIYLIKNTESNRSNSHFTFNKLWNNEYNLFTIVLNYCKMYRIGIFMNEVDKKIRFIPFNKYFQSYTIEDWTDKLDLSKDYIVTPISFENKYVLFNYNEHKTKLGEQYKNEYGVNYGEKRLITDYNFNTETTNLFESIPTSIVSTPSFLSWSNLYDNFSVTYSLPAEKYIDCEDKDGKYVDVFGQFYFHNGLTSFSTESPLYMRSVIISDDTASQIANNTFFYNQYDSSRFISCTTYPELDIIRDKQLCVFNTPSVNYTYLNDYVDSTGIYEEYWKNYLNERYNTQNKKVTCYLRLRPIDYINFQFNHFVKIENQLYMVNKIYDYNVNSDIATKVDLITIQDPAGYAN